MRVTQLALPDFLPDHLVVRAGVIQAGVIQFDFADKSVKSLSLIGVIDRQELNLI